MQRNVCFLVGGIPSDLLGSSEDVSILCAGQTYCGSIDNGHQFIYVFHQDSVEKPLVPLLDAHQVNVPEEVRSGR